MKKGELSHLARPGSEIAVRVTPKAARNAVIAGSAGLRVNVTAAPEDGKANQAVVKLLAAALGVPKSAPHPRARRHRPRQGLPDRLSFFGRKIPRGERSARPAG